MVLIPARLPTVAQSGTIDTTERERSKHDYSTRGAIRQALLLRDQGHTELSCGTHSSCVVVDGDSVWCWGSNDNGALGDGTDTARTAPVEVQGLSEASINTVEAGYYAGCASVGATGKVECWGINDAGLVGDGTTTATSVPVENGVTGATQIEMGLTHACALTSTDKVYCWGHNGHG